MICWLMALKFENLSVNDPLNDEEFQQSVIFCIKAIRQDKPS